MKYKMKHFLVLDVTENILKQALFFFSSALVLQSVFQLSEPINHSLAFLCTPPSSLHPDVIFPFVTPQRCGARAAQCVRGQEVMLVGAASSGGLQKLFSYHSSSIEYQCPGTRHLRFSYAHRHTHIHTHFWSTLQWPACADWWLVHMSKEMLWGIGENDNMTANDISSSLLHPVTQWRGEIWWGVKEGVQKCSVKNTVRQI